MFIIKHSFVITSIINLSVFKFGLNIRVKFTKLNDPIKIKLVYHFHLSYYLFIIDFNDYILNFSELNQILVKYHFVLS